MQNEAIEPNAKDENQIDQQVFKPASWQIQFEKIKQDILSNILITVLAEPASGKTTFIKLLQSEIQPLIESKLFKARPSFTKNEFLAELFNAFNLKMDSESTFAKVVAHINEQKVPQLIIIDDAQHLPESMWQDIFVELKKQGDSGFFHLCLVSDFSCSHFLNKFEPELFKIFEPGNLTAAETKTYLCSVLPLSKKLEQFLTKKELEKFYNLTKGNIAAINAQMNYFFSSAAIKSEDKYKYLLRSSSFLAAAAVALVVSSYLWPDRFLPSSQKDEEFNSQVVAEIIQPLPSLISAIPEQEPVLLSRLIDIKQEFASKRSLLPSLYVGAITQQAQPSPKRVVDISIDDNDENLVLRDRVVVIPKNLNRLPSKTIEQKIALKTAVGKKSLLPKIKALPPKVFKTAGKIKPKKQAKIKNNSFTIQLMASPNQAKLKKFVATQKINKLVKIRLTKRDGIEWYVLTIGEYKQREQAKAYIQNLPASLSQFNPWVRPLAQLSALG